MPTATATGTPTATSTPTATATAGAAGRPELSHGYREARSIVSGSGSGAPDDVYRIAQQPYSSYEVVVDSTSGDIGPGLLVQRVTANLATVLQNAQPVSGLNFSQSLRFGNATSVPVLDQRIRVRSASCTTNCGSDDVYRLRTYETTVSLSRFNNGGGQVTVVFVQNVSGAPVAGTVYFWNAAGALSGTSPLSLAPQAQLTLNTASVPGLAGQGGSVTIAHDAPYGTLVGKAVSLEPSTGFSFDTPLLPRLR